MLNRRDLIARAATTAALLALGRHAAAAGALTADATLAATPGDPDRALPDYKALVCVFLFGGNDANQMVLPLDAARLAEHRRLRAPAALAFDAEALTALPAADGGAPEYGLHPALAPLAPLWRRGQLALLLNTGALVEPLTRVAWLGRGARPDNLFSHADQQDFAQALASPGGSGADSGWGYRAARRLGLAAPGVGLPSLVSFDGNQRFVQGDVRAALVLPARGTFALTGGTDAAAAARAQAFRALWAGAATPIARQAGEVIGSALGAARVANPLLTDASPLVDAAFTPAGAAAPLNADIAQQLQRVARLISARAVVGNRRQVFFVGMNGYDTHVDQARAQQRLYTDLGAALAAFQASLDALGVADRVTTFTQSDFSRTLKPNGNGGTDHGWGGHQLVLGGAVNGRRAFGRLPVLAAGGPDDAGAEGRWIPGIAHDQVAATLARWFGVDTDGLLEVAPHLARFETANLGFMA